MKANPKPFFSSVELGEGGQAEERTLPPCGSVQFFSTSGTVTVRFGESDAVPVRTGSTFELPYPLTFDRVVVIVTTGSTAIVNFGLGSFGGGASSGGGLVGTGAPVQSAAAGTVYYDTASGAFYVNSDGTSTGWAALIV